MAYPQLDNPKGAFGYGSTVAAGQRQGPLHKPEIQLFRNASRKPIQYGQIVTLYVDSPPYNSSAGGSTAQVGTTADDFGYVTTVLSQRGIMGIAIGAASSITNMTSLAVTPRFNAPSSQYVQVVTRGPFYGALCTTVAHNPGDILVNTNATVTDATTAEFGGIGGAASTVTVPITTAQMTLSMIGTVGWFITTATTVGSTLYGTSGAGRANVWVQPSNIAFISGTT